MAIFKCSIDLGMFEANIEAKDSTTAQEMFITQIQEDMKDYDVNVELSDNQYTDQQELADRERET